MRTCTIATLDKLARLRPSEDRPAWLRAAISDSLNGHAVSLDREDRMCKALGIASPKRDRRRFYRPCLSVELGEAIREDRIDLESLLWTVIVAGRQERKKRAA